MLGFVLSLALGVSADATPAEADVAARAVAPARYVVIIGYNGPADGEKPPLSWADDDAARMYKLFSQGARRAWLLASFDKESVRTWGTLVDIATEPSKRELARVLGEAYWAMRDEPAGAELVFAFAGHGDVSSGGEGYVLLADGAFSRSDLERQVVAASPAKTNHIIADACAAYFLVGRGDNKNGDAVVPLGKDLLQLFAKPSADDAAWSRTGVMVATSDAAEVHESAAVGGGVFSFLLRSALTGGADSNLDGRIEYGETAAFIAAANATVPDPRARLAITARAPKSAPHAPLLDLQRAGVEHYLVIDEQDAVQLRLVDAQGLPYAALHREAGSGPTLIALVGNPFYVVERGTQEAVLVPRSAGGYALSSLRFGPAPTTRSVEPRLQRLFAVPYGPNFLGGFVAQGDLPPPSDGQRLVVTWAQQGEPPFVPPWGTLATGSFVVAGVLATGALVSVGGNAFALADLDARFRETGTLDPALALQADSWLAAAAVLGTTAVAATALGGGFALAAATEDDE